MAGVCFRQWKGIVWTRCTLRTLCCAIRKLCHSVSADSERLRACEHDGPLPPPSLKERERETRASLKLGTPLFLFNSPQPPPIALQTWDVIHVEMTPTRLGRGFRKPRFSLKWTRARGIFLSSGCWRISVVPFLPFLTDGAPLSWPPYADTHEIVSARRTRRA